MAVAAAVKLVFALALAQVVLHGECTFDDSEGRVVVNLDEDSWDVEVSLVKG